MKLEEPSKILKIILENYKENIKRKYKMIHDYPFILSYEFADIYNNGKVKCIYREFRKNNKKMIKTSIIKYKKICKDSIKYNNENSEITEIDTDN